MRNTITHHWRMAFEVVLMELLVKAVKETKARVFIRWVKLLRPPVFTSKMSKEISI
jgi:hypothetical protein